jgi:hypothetical protein
MVNGGELWCDSYAGDTYRFDRVHHGDECDEFATGSVQVWLYDLEYKARRYGGVDDVASKSQHLVCRLGREPMTRGDRVSGHIERFLRITKRRGGLVDIKPPSFIN